MIGRTMPAVMLGIFALGSAGAAEAGDPRGVWMIENKAAVRIFDCGDALCGRIVWLGEPRDAMGKPKRDRQNPDPSLRDRALCGLDVLTGLQGGSQGWQGGSFYNPQDGHRYGASMRMQSDDEMVARFFVGMPILGKNKMLRRLSASEERTATCQTGMETAASVTPRGPGG
jgi:uncharacterized protein (DUF2147 family)